MSSTFMKGLDLLRVVDEQGPIGVSELARVLGADKAAVSRMVAAAEADGWVERIDGRVMIGPSAAVLGSRSATAEAIRLAEPLVHALAGVTGLVCQALALLGDTTTPLVSVNGGGDPLERGNRVRLPIWAGAGPKVIGAQLTDARVQALVPHGALPETGTILGSLGMLSDVEIVRISGDGDEGGESTAASTRDELLEQYAGIRRDRMFYERGELAPEIACIAVPWPVATPSALTCIGPRATIARRFDLVLGCLRAAARPGALREDVVRAASGRS